MLRLMNVLLSPPPAARMSGLTFYYRVHVPCMHVFMEEWRVMSVPSR